jgi:hypothetical protein
LLAGRPWLVNYSCSYGAGRKMGRIRAMKEIDLEKEIAFLEKQGILP